MIDYYSRYLLAIHLSHSYSAIEVAKADQTQAGAEAIHAGSPVRRSC